MRRPLFIGAAAALTAAAGVAFAVNADASVVSPAPTVTVGANVLQIMNAARAKAHCRAVKVNDRLSGAAALHAQDMARRNYFSHVTPDGVQPDVRIGEQGYVASAIGETIAKGERTPQAVVAHWLATPADKATILNCRFVDAGVGVTINAKGTLLWTVDFGRPR